MCVEALVKSAVRHICQAQMLAQRFRHKTNRLVTGALRLVLLAVCSGLNP